MKKPKGNNSKATFYNKSFERLQKSIENIEQEQVKDIYALSFWFLNEGDELHFPSIILSYNTISNFKDNLKNASSEAEAQWNFAFWLQNELEIIGGEDDEYLSEWFKNSAYYYSEEEYELAEDNDELFDKLCLKGEKFNQEFIDLIIEISSNLHQTGVIEKVFSQPIPIIIHKLEYDDEIAQWTEKGNPAGLVDDFSHWVKNI